MSDRDPDDSEFDRTREIGAESTGEATRRATGRSGPPRLARYEIHEAVGEGATAIVYRAWDRQLARPVAIKVLRETTGFSELARSRFRREAQAAAALSHPNVVAVHDSGEADGLLYIVMEYVEGRSLTDVLTAGSADRRGLIGLVARAARGVAAAHAQGIVHRDLKPANLIITAAGEPKVGDFGLAHLLDSTTALTRTGSTLGTPLYMAPEQVEGRPERITPASDVYALGAICYQILSGRPPVDGETVAEIYLHLLRDEPTPLRRKDATVPIDLETAVAKAMEKDPRRRYPDAGALADDLDRWLAGEPVLARPLGKAERLRRKILRHRPVALLGGVLILAMTLGGGGWLLRKARRDDAVRLHLTEAARWETAHELEKARSCYREALEVDPARADARDGFRRTDERLRAPAEALGILETARPVLELGSQMRYSPETTVEAFLARLAKARQIVEQALRTAPDLAPAHLLLGNCWEIQGRPERAEPSYRKALELDPSYGLAHYHLGRVLLERSYLASKGATREERSQNRPEAERLIREGVEAIEAAFAASSGMEDPLRREIARASLAYVQRKQNVVKQIAGRAIEAYGSRQGVEEFHWLVASTSSDPAEERDAYDRALRIRPVYPLARFGRATYRLLSGDWSGAREDFDALLALNPDDVLTLNNRAALFIGEKDGASALADMERVIRLEPNLARGYVNRSAARFLAKDEKGGLADLDRAIELDPGIPMAWTVRGGHREQMGNIEGAISDYGRALRLLPNDADLHARKGFLHMQCYEFEAAVENLDRTLKLDPSNYEAFRQRGRARHVLGDFKGAGEDFRASLRAAPAEWKWRKQLQEAIAAAESGEPKLQWSRESLWRAERAFRANMIPEAILLYKRGLKDDPPSVEKGRANYRLASCLAPQADRLPEAERKALINEALDYLEAAGRAGFFNEPGTCCAGRHPDRRAHVRGDIWLASLRQEARFVKLIGPEGD
jgi:serine/threonine protein kinase/lipoprotein NlpI